MNRLIVDFQAGTVEVQDGDGKCSLVPIGSADGFAAISRAWLRSGWDAKYVYSFTWLGRPIIQLPEDLLRLQEVIWRLRPDVIIETGVAHGGGLIFYASLCEMMNKGRVIGIDIEIRPHNRRALEAHPLFKRITLIEGSSIDPGTVEKVRTLLAPGETALVLLDSRHTKQHVQAELAAYSPFVSPGSYLVAMDGIMQDLVGAPRSQPDWGWDNPRQAALEFATHNPDFVLDDPPFLFNEGMVTQRVTYWPGAFLRCVGR